MQDLHFDCEHHRFPTQLWWLHINLDAVLMVPKCVRADADGNRDFNRTQWCAAVPDARKPPKEAKAGLARHLDLGAVPHGFRSSFRDWAAERTDAPREVCEIALAHVNTDRVEAAYRRADLFERRRALIGDWADYVAGGGSGG